LPVPARAARSRIRTSPRRASSSRTSGACGRR
jgi:hypothetical protein